MEQTKKFNDCKELIYEIVDKNLHVSKEQILSKVKKRKFADARRIIIRVLKNSFPKTKVIILGEIVAKDHSNVSTQLKEHFNLYGKSTEYTDMFNLIESEFNSALHLENKLTN